MTNAMVVYERMAELQTAANAMHASGYFGDVKSQAQAMVKVLAGAEIGLPPFASMTGIHVVNGKPVIGSNLIATLVKNDPRYDYRVKQADDTACVIQWYEGGRLVGESSFTRQEAAAGNVDKSWDKEKSAWKEKATWKAFPSDMLFARAISRGARRYAPGIFGGAPIYTPDEMGVDTDEDGHIVQGEVINVTPPANGKATAAQLANAPLDAYLAHAEQRPGVKAVAFANGRLRAWVNYVTGDAFDPAHADYLNEVLDRYCSAVADNDNTHTKAAAEKARDDYVTGLVVRDGEWVGGDEPDGQEGLLAANSMGHIEKAGPQRTTQPALVTVEPPVTAYQD